MRYLENNVLVTFTHDVSILNDPTVMMDIYVEGNCLNESEIRYTSEYVEIDYGDSQGRCAEGMCGNEERKDGCVLCEENGECVTCNSGYVLYVGRCVKCNEWEDCPFNNSNEVYCDGVNDTTHCNISGAIGCWEHVCVDRECVHGEYGLEKECGLGGDGCIGCRCGKGWHINYSYDCYSECGDGDVVGDEECEIGGDGCDGRCRCLDGWKSIGEFSCMAICGDGIVVGNEECDGGDGCGKRCRCSDGWYPVMRDGIIKCETFCGDGIAAGDEQCEIGDMGCNDECRCGRGWFNYSIKKSCLSICGDGIVVGNEQCEIGGIGCDKSCRCQEGWKGTGSIGCKEVCGDGFIVGIEECDGTEGCGEICLCTDKNPYNNETKDCMWCGNGILEVDEECDMSEHCDNKTCRCLTGYSYSNQLNICVNDDNGGGNDIIGIVIGIGISVMILIIVVVVIGITYMYRKFNGDEGYSLMEIGNDGRIDVIGSGGKKCGRLNISKNVYENETTIVMVGKMDGKVDVAVKCMKMWGTQLDSKQEREMDIMSKLNSEFIVMFYGTSIIEGRTGLVMEYIAMGSLETFMSKKEFSSTLKVRYAKDICMGMNYLHKNNIIHRDLKLSNVLVVSDDAYSSGAVCKISDFGTSRDMDISTTVSMTQSMTMTSNIGTPLYMAPEILNGMGKYSVKADVYSYGIVLSGLWNQTIPYSGVRFEDVGELLSRISTKGLRPTLRDDCPQSYINLANACWQQNPHDRPTFDEISHGVFDA